ncbi:hypothetical protein D9758_016565 [Tetrapyrgos nigripes]|uniref:Myb-like domain-containing protein n=1 Tax=Tetrapyrgos nigripes TaxID=182062 RepID=A0A8H5BZG4_9AGAR|nr:hypothetical protein D9758_016565 [Tetrapyrgos nigripes]
MPNTTPPTLPRVRLKLGPKPVNADTPESIQPSGTDKRRMHSSKPQTGENTPSEDQAAQSKGPKDPEGASVTKNTPRRRGPRTTSKNLGENAKGPANTKGKSGKGREKITSDPAVNQASTTNAAVGQAQATETQSQSQPEHQTQSQLQSPSQSPLPLPSQSQSPLQSQSPSQMQSDTPLETDGQLDADVEEETNWTDADKMTMAEYLLSVKHEAGDNSNFKTAVWREAATTVNAARPDAFPKTPIGCKNKWFNFFWRYHQAALDIINASGLHFDPKTGVDVTPELESVWEDLCRRNKHCGYFRDRGWPYYDIMMQIMPSSNRNSHSFYPGATRASPDWDFSQIDALLGEPQQTQSMPVQATATVIHPPAAAGQMATTNFRTPAKRPTTAAPSSEPLSKRVKVPSFQQVAIENMGTIGKSVENFTNVLAHYFERPDNNPQDSGPSASSLRTTASAMSATLTVLESPTKVALHLVQDDGSLSLEEKLDMIDYFTKNPSSIRTFLTLEGEVRKGWVQRKLGEIMRMHFDT